jgi:hypothetical protein
MHGMERVKFTFEIFNFVSTYFAVVGILVDAVFMHDHEMSLTLHFFANSYTDIAY